MERPFSSDQGVSVISIIGALALCLFALILRNALASRSKKLQNTAKVSEKPTGTPKPEDREPGEWMPVEFDYPDVPVCKEDWKDIKPIPYRPFRWGEYHVTMGIRHMPWDEWIELDQQFVDYHKIRVHRIETRGEHVVKTLPENPGVVGSGHPGAVELVHELAEYLSRRYPAVYIVTRHPPAPGSISWYGLGQIKDITVVPLGKTFNLGEEDPMRLSALLIQEDLAIMVEGTDGRYYFQAGAVCIPGWWNMGEKLGMALDEIHISGHVPQFETKLNMSMARFFKRMPVDKPVVRNNYTFQVVPEEEKQDGLDPIELAWAKTMKGEEDAQDVEVESTSRRYGSLDGLVLKPSTVWLRTERQTLRRLPRSGVIVFTIRVYQTSVERLGKEAGVPGRMASAIRSWSEEVARYKAKGAYEGILGYLDQCHREQVEGGIEAPETSHPF